MAHTMSQDEYKAFLTHGTRTAKVATTRADGRPHVAPVWFVLDGDDLIVRTGADTVKGRDLRRQPQVSISVDDENAPYSFVLIDGTATLSDDPEALHRWATEIGGRYMGTDRAEEFGKRNGVPGELLVRVTPRKVIAQADIAE